MLHLMIISTNILTSKNSSQIRSGIHFVRVMDTSIGSLSSLISMVKRESAHIMTRLSGSRQEFLSGQVILRFIQWISILILSKNITQKILQWMTEQQTFLTQFFVRTGDTSVLRMHLSSLTDIRTTVQLSLT